MPETLPLRDVIAIEPAWWPPAPAWWLLAIVLILFVWIALKSLLRYFTPPYSALKKVALSELDQIQSADMNDQQLAAQLSSLLKRVALQRFPDQKTARLSGKKWLEFLNGSVSEAYFQRVEASALDTIQYQRTGSFNRAQLLSATHNWLKAL